MRRDSATATVRRIQTFAGEVVLLHGIGYRYASGTDAGPFSLKTVRRGVATWRSQGRTVRLHETMFAFLDRGAPYQVAIGGDAPVETTCLFFSTEMHTALSAVRSDGLAENAPPPSSGWHLHASICDAARLDRLVRLVTDSSLPAAATIDDWLLADLPPLFAAHLRHDRLGEAPAVRTATRQELHRRVARGREFLLDHLCEPVSLRAAAQHAAISPFHFHRLFKALYGAPPLRYVTERRLERAAFALRHSALPVTDISLACGFESLSSFGRAFVRRFGMSPGQYRRTN